MKPNITLILGTTRKGNQSHKVAISIDGILKRKFKIVPRILDLSTSNFPIMEERIGHWENPPQKLLEWNNHLQQTNGIIIIAPEYKNGYPGSLKNFLDYLPKDIFRYKPIGICTVTSGNYGGSNCLAQLRLVCLAMGGLPIPDRFQVSDVINSVSETDYSLQKTTESIAIKFISELLKYTESLYSLQSTAQSDS